MYAIAGVIYRHQCNICRFNGVATCQYLEKVIRKKSPPKKIGATSMPYNAMLCHMPLLDTWLLFFLNYCLSPPRENLPWRLKRTLWRSHFFPLASNAAKRPNQTLAVWDSSVGSRRVVASAYRCRVRPCCPKGPTNKCAPKQERSSKTWSFSSDQNTTLSDNVCVCVVYIYIYMGVSKNKGTPKWMVYNGNPY